MVKKKVSILGLGWYGSPLADELIRQGFDVIGSTRTESKLEAHSRLLNYPDLPTEELMNADIVVLNIPPFPEELDWFKSWPWKKPWMIFISSISGSETLLKQEAWVRENFQDWTILRFGGLLGGNRHPGKHLSGKKNLAAPKRVVNLLHLDDAVGVTLAVIKKNVKGSTLDVVCDEHRTREEFYSEYCRENNLPVPEFDQSDFSTGKIIPNEEVKKFYTFRNS